MLQCLAHRGPDDQGVFYGQQDGVHVARMPSTVEAGARVTMLHRRLSILDLSESGWQPMSSPDGRFHLVFNGEIYNYVELGEALASEGYGPFRSTSDTEVLLAGFARWGTSVLPRLVGMFAFAVFDVQEQRLILARDFAGIKPLYYGYWRDGLAFGSEIKALFTLPGISRRIDPGRAYEYLHHGLTDYGTDTLYADIRQVPAAHYLAIDLDRLDAPRLERYWTLHDETRTDLSFEAAADRLRDLFLTNVRLHMRSDVPVGAALSGGIDSTAIVAGMRHLFPESEIHTFSYIAEDERLSEERWVDLAGRHVGATLHRVCPTAAEMVADLPELIRIQDEPFGSTSIYAQYRVFRLAREVGIKVMLDGQGADELFGGYKLHVAARLASLVRSGRLVEAAHFVRYAARYPVAGRWLEQVAYALAMLLPEGVQAPFVRLWGRESVPEWLDMAWFTDRGVAPRLHLWHAQDSRVLREMLERSFGETILPMLLRYEDRNSMAHSIESRVPFLTPEMAAFTFSLPERYIIGPDGTTKSVLRRALRGLVPDAILDRKDKIGFVTPEKAWLAQLRPWVERVLEDPAARRIPFLRLDVVRAEWEAVLAGRTRFDFRVWRWINFIEWVKQNEVRFDE